MEITITMKIDDEVLKDMFVGTDIHKKEFIERPSEYARYFDEASPAWRETASMNLLFLKQQMCYANDLLRRRSRNGLFLNEVYDMLGLPRTKIGQLVGWVYDPNNPIGDNYVDFDLYNDRNREFINGWNKPVLLDFNVDGNILNYL